jgi:hypothetical protein
MRPEGRVTAALVTFGLAAAAHAQFEIPKIKPPKLDIPTTIKPPKPETEKEGPQTVECPKFEAVKAQQQESVWCWATCAEMIYKYHKKDTTQKEIAERIHGFKDNGDNEVRAASLYEIMIALAEEPGSPDRARRFAKRFGEQLAKNPTKGPTLDVGKYLGAWMNEEAVDTDDLIAELKRKEPVVIGMATDPRFEGGHAMVVYGATFKLAGSSGIKRTIDANDRDGLTKSAGAKRYTIISLKVMDPWTGEAAELTGEHVEKDCDFLMSQKKAKAILKQEESSVR